MRKANEIKNTQDLRAMLLDTIKQVREGQIDHRQASAIGGLTTKILQSAKLDLDVMRFHNSLGEKGVQHKALQLVANT